MGSVHAYASAKGRRHRVLYRKPDNSQGQSRGFTTKKEAQLFLSTVLGGGSVEHHGGANDASGFLLNMSKVFEDFVEASIARASKPFGGEVVGQHSAPLDSDGIVTIRPDVVWRLEGRIRAIFDAKYKVVHSDAYPNADIYQMLAFCVRHDVADGHLVYADGDPLPRVIEIVGGRGDTVARVHAHRLDLTHAPPQIETQLAAIVASALHNSDPARNPRLRQAAVVRTDT